MGIELLVGTGACDVTLQIEHEEDERAANTPESLLAWLIKAIPFSAVPLPRVIAALGLGQQSKGLDFQVRCLPPPAHPTLVHLVFSVAAPPPAPPRSTASR